VVSKHLALFEDFVACIKTSARPWFTEIDLDDDDVVDTLARRLVHLTVLHGLLPELSPSSEPTGPSVAPIETSTS